MRLADFPPALKFSMCHETLVALRRRLKVSMQLVEKEIGLLNLAAFVCGMGEGAIHIQGASTKTKERLVENDTSLPGGGNCVSAV